MPKFESVITAPYFVGLTSLQTRSGTATVPVYETSVCTAASTLTLPASPPEGCTNVVIAQSGVTTINRSGTQTINHYATTGMTSLTIPQGMSVVLVFSSQYNTWFVTHGGFTTGQQLARAYVASASYGVASSLGAIDATNLSVSVIVPPSGAYVVRLQAAGYACTGTNNAQYTKVGVLLHGTSTQLGEIETAVQGDFNTPDGYGRAGGVVLDVDVTGQTAGAAQQLDFAAISNSGGNASVYAPAKIKVFAA